MFFFSSSKKALRDKIIETEKELKNSNYLIIKAATNFIHESRLIDKLLEKINYEKKDDHELQVKSILLNSILQYILEKLPHILEQDNAIILYERLEGEIITLKQPCIMEALSKINKLTQSELHLHR